MPPTNKRKILVESDRGEISIQDARIGENGVPVCKLESSRHPSSLANSGTALVIENSPRSFSPMCVVLGCLYVCLLMTLLSGSKIAPNVY